MEARPHFSKQLLHPRYWLIWLGLGLWRLIVLLPYPLLLVIGRGLGRLIYLTGKKRRYFAARNIELCFPEKSPEQRQALLKENFASNGIAMLETGIAWWWSNERFEKLLQFKGLEHIENLDGQGALLMAMHFTTLEVGASAISTRICMDGMYRPNNNAVFDYVQRKGREKRVSEGRVYPRQDVRGVLKGLREGRLIWYAPDQDYGRKQSVFAPFFGVTAASVAATAKLAERGRAAVLPFTHTRLPNGRGYMIEVHPPLDNYPVGDDVADATRINRELEQFIRQQPEQYLWVHRRFKTRPEGEPSLYSVKKKRRRRKRRK